MENTRVKNLRGLQNSLYDVYNALLMNAIDNKDAMVLVSTANTIIKAEQTMFVIAKNNRGNNELLQSQEKEPNIQDKGTITTINVVRK